MHILKCNVISTLFEMYSLKSWLLAGSEKWITIVNFFFFNEQFTFTKLQDYF